MNKSEVSELFSIFDAAYGKKFVNENPMATISFWASMLEDIPAFEVFAATKRVIATRVNAFPPTIGELRREVTRARYPSLLITAEDAWGEVWSAVKSKGLNNRPEWSHPALAATVESIGWRELCLTGLDNLGTLRAQFMRVYEAKREHCETQETVPAAIRILPPKPKAEVLRLDHTSTMEVKPLKLAVDLEEYSSPETTATNLASIRAMLEAKNIPEVTDGESNRVPASMVGAEDNL